ncbi:MAG: hypothetical protein ABEH38_06835 [Flavobacteriales bacterium]
MMHFYKRSFVTLTLLFICSALYAQKPIVFSTGGSYGAAGNYVKIYSYHPNKDTLFVQDSVPGDFSNDVMYDGSNYYLHVGRASGHPAGGDAIYVYDEYSFNRVDSIQPINGATQIGYKGDHIIVTRGFGASSNFVQVYDRTNFLLGPTYNDDTIGTSVNGLTVRGDSAYVGYTKNDTGHLATIDLSGSTPSFGTIHKMDTLSGGVDELIQDQDEVYALSERYDASFNFLYAGVSSYDPASGSYSTDTVDSRLAKSSYVQNDSVWVGVDSMMSVYEKGSGNFIDLFSADHTDGIFDSSASRFYFLRTDFATMGDLLITDGSGTRIDSFSTDISGEAMGMISPATVSVGPDKSVM